MIDIYIHIFPDNEIFCYSFDEYKSFKVLKNKLREEQKIKKGEYYMEMNEHIVNDDITLKENGIVNHSVINIIRNDFIIIKVERKNYKGENQVMHMYMPVLDFKVIKADENKIVKVCNNIL